MKIDINSTVPVDGLIVLPVVKSEDTYTSLVSDYEDLLKKNILPVCLTYPKVAT